MAATVIARSRAAASWLVNDKRVERIWRREGLKVPYKQPKRGRLWLADGSCIRLRPQHRNHVWSYDFVEDRTHDGRRYRMLNVIDEFTHECLATRVARKLKAIDVIDVLSDLFILRGVPGHIRSDNGPEFVAEAVQAWITAVGAKTAYIERGSPWENGYVESFNARLRDELLNGEIFYTLREAQIVIESWRRHYNTIRPHASIGYKPPAPEVFVSAFAAWPAALRRPAPPATLAQRPTLESVRKHQAGLQSFRSMRRIEASRRNASALRLRFSQSLASLRQRLSQAKVRSTTQRRGSTTNPFVRSERLTISVSS